MATTTATAFRLSARKLAVLTYQVDQEAIYAAGREFAARYDQATAAWHAAPEGSDLARERGEARQRVYAEAFRAGYRLY